jgi:hypothetical protein
MTIEEARRDLEDAAALLVGHAVTRVRYLGAWASAPEDPDAYVEWVELTMEDGAVLRVTTDPDFGTDGIAIYEGPFPGPEEHLQVLDAGTRSGWARVLGHAVTGSTVHWSAADLMRIDVADDDRGSVSARTTRVDVPSDLELRFANGDAVFLTASSWDGEGGLVPEQDNVAVVFGDADATRLGIGPSRRP